MTEVGDNSELRVEAVGGREESLMLPDEALKWATRSHDLCAERCQSGVTVFTSALSLIWQREEK